MNYIGSKSKSSPWIKEEVIKQVGEDLSEKIFCDLFAGTGIIGRTFKGRVKEVISNDMEYYSFVLNKNYIANTETIDNEKNLIDTLNNLPLLKSGFIYKNYCLGSGSDRQYFSDYNGQKIDTIRLAIKEWKEEKKINDKEYYFLLASLLESADKVANTASVYGAFLKHIKKTASQELLVKPACFTKDSNIHRVYNEDSNSLIYKISGDILYLDPPYNQRQYSANYHILNTISLYDDFIPKGKTGLREYTRSNYSKKREVHRSFEELIKNAQFEYIFLSYNNEGLMSQNEVQTIMQKYGNYQLSTKEYSRFRSDKIENRNHKANKTLEYLHILKK